MTMESTKKRYRYLKDRFGVDHIDNVPDPKEVIEEELERINFSDKREDHLEDRCFRCGSEEDLILVLPKVKNDIRDYRHFETFKGLLYDICKEPYDGPTGGKNVDKFNDFILENWDRLIEIFEEEVKAFKERYTDLDKYITVCESCNILIYNYNLYLCQSCEDNLHPAKYDKCYSCVIEEDNLKLCPTCQQKYYDPSKYDRCKICRS